MSETLKGRLSAAIDDALRATVERDEMRDRLDSALARLEWSTQQLDIEQAATKAATDRLEAILAEVGKNSKLCGYCNNALHIATDGRSRMDGSLPVVEKRRTDSPETNDELADKARWS